MTDLEKSKWFEELGRACCEEFNIEVGTPIEHQCGGVFVGDIGIMSSGFEPEPEPDNEWNMDDLKNEIGSVL